MAYIQNPILSTLPGFDGSNPEIVNALQLEVPTNKDEILEKVLPNGAQPGQFFVNFYQKMKILSYVFEIHQADSRNDLTSVSFALSKKTNIDNLKTVLQEIFKRLEENNLLSLEIVHKNLDNIMEALNKESKLKIGTFVFDVSYFLKANKVKLDENRRIRGSMI
jgi:hypothetical protein